MILGVVDNRLVRSIRSAGAISVLVLGLGAASCTSKTQTTTHPPQGASRPSPSSGCHSGTYSMTASLATPASSVCVHTGTTLIVTFDKSAGGQGFPGPWTIPPLAVLDPSVLTLTSSSPNGHLITAFLKAAMPGTTAVSANFDEECSANVTTTCTIPPQGAMNVHVTVEAP
jgi:hypothetical protein